MSASSSAVAFRPSKPMTPARKAPCPTIRLVSRHLTIFTLGFFNKLRHRGRNIGIPLAADRGKLLHQFQFFRFTGINSVSALTGHLGGDALKQLGLTAAVGQKGRITVRVKINKAGSCRQPAKVYDFLCFLCYRLLGKYCNFPLCNPDIPMKGASPVPS